MSIASPHRSERPRLGVVLGGGGARAVAHIGVLLGLERAGLAPDLVVGVSMGAVVAATYGARDDWLGAFLSADRSRLPALAGIDHDHAFARMRGTLRSARRMAPTMWTLGRRGYQDYGRVLLSELLGDRDRFEDLRVPTAITATDLADGERAVFHEGDVISAVLASAAIPGITRPVHRAGSTYIDGGFADPSPVDVARAMGADVVVAIHVGHRQVSTEADSWATAMLRGFEATQHQFANHRLATADHVVRPAFEDRVTMLDFSEAEEVARAGWSSVRAHTEAIRALLDAHRAAEVGS